MRHGLEGKRFRMALATVSVSILAVTVSTELTAEAGGRGIGQFIAPRRQGRKESILLVRTWRALRLCASRSDCLLRRSRAGSTVSGRCVRGEVFLLRWYGELHV
jgi:hypothetical protein